ncbi:MAG: hypothetical protein GF381_00405 [Candidatus Pacebacteria bacterium]|nr:hypothetical protein [Candidatus Paceibacterota bacterium]
MSKEKMSESPNIRQSEPETGGSVRGSQEVVVSGEPPRSAETRQLTEYYEILEQFIGRPDIEPITPQQNWLANLLTKANEKFKKGPIGSLFRLFISRNVSLAEKLIASSTPSYREDRIWRLGTLWAKFALMFMGSKLGAEWMSKYELVEHNLATRFSNPGVFRSEHGLDLNYISQKLYWIIMERLYQDRGVLADTRMDSVRASIKDLGRLPIVELGKQSGESRENPFFLNERTEEPAIVDLGTVELRNGELVLNPDLVDGLVNQMDHRPFIVVHLQLHPKNGPIQSVISFVINHEYLDGVPVSNWFDRLAIDFRVESQPLGSKLEEPETTTQEMRTVVVKRGDDNNQEGGPVRVYEQKKVVSTDPDLFLRGPDWWDQEIDQSEFASSLGLETITILQQAILPKTGSNMLSRRNLFTHKPSWIGELSLEEIEIVLRFLEPEKSLGSYVRPSRLSEEECGVCDQIEHLASGSKGESDPYRVETYVLSQEEVGKINQLYKRILENFTDSSGRQLLRLSYYTFFELFLLSSLGVDGNLIRGGVLRFSFSEDPDNTESQLSHWDTGNAVKAFTALVKGDFASLEPYLVGGSQQKPPKISFKNMGNNLAAIEALSGLPPEIAWEIAALAQELGVVRASSGQIMASVIPDKLFEIYTGGLPGPALVPGQQDCAITASLQMDREQELWVPKSIVLRVKMRERLNLPPTARRLPRSLTVS